MTMASPLPTIRAQNAAMRALLEEVEANDRMKAALAARGIPAPAVQVTMTIIATTVAKDHGMTLAQLKAPTRRHAVAHPRQEAMWLMREVRRGDGQCRWSLPQVGRFFGLDHTTAMHGVRAHAGRMSAKALQP